MYITYGNALLSYRWLVTKILSLINPGDVELRKRNRLIWRIYIAYAYCHIQGPNYCWHVDGYDKSFWFCNSWMCGWVSYVWTHKLYTPKYISYMTCIIQYLSLKNADFLGVFCG